MSYSSRRRRGRYSPSRTTTTRRRSARLESRSRRSALRGRPTERPYRGRATRAHDDDRYERPYRGRATRARYEDRYESDRPMHRSSRRQPALRDRPRLSSRSRWAKSPGKWGGLPRGWTEESAKKYWNSIGGSVHECIRDLDGNTEITDPGAFCASLKDRLQGEQWRHEPHHHHRHRKQSSVAPQFIRVSGQIYKRQDTAPRVRRSSTRSRAHSSHRSRSRRY